MGRWMLALALLGAALAAGACSMSPWRTDSLLMVEIDGREVALSWIRMSEDDVDIVAFDSPDLDFKRFSTPLDAATARKAAEQFVADRCGGDDLYVSLRPQVTFADARHAFRYACVDVPMK